MSIQNTPDQKVKTSLQQKDMQRNQPQPQLQNQTQCEDAHSIYMLSLKLRSSKQSDKLSQQSSQKSSRMQRQQPQNTQTFTVLEEQKKQLHLQPRTIVGDDQKQSQQKTRKVNKIQINPPQNTSTPVMAQSVPQQDYTQLVQNTLSLQMKVSQINSQNTILNSTCHSLILNNMQNTHTNEHIQSNIKIAKDQIKVIDKDIYHKKKEHKSLQAVNSKLKAQKSKLNDNPPNPITYFNNQTVQICLILDCTGSMQAKIGFAQQEMTNIIHNLQKQYEGLKIQFAFIGYRDFGDQYIKQEFTSNTQSVIDTLKSVSAIGGGDEEEDVNGGLVDALTLNWDPNSIKKIFLICDASGHQYDMHKLKQSMMQLSAKGIFFEILSTIYSTKNMIDTMTLSYNKDLFISRSF